MRSLRYRGTVVLRSWLPWVLLLAGPALGQSLPDASLPDASVGQGGADHTSEENDPSGPCLASTECDHGLQCVNGRCVPQGIRDATFSCSGAAPVVPLALAAAALGRRRRQRRR